MPPTRRRSGSASRQDTEAGGRSPANITPKSIMESYRICDKTKSPARLSPSPGALDTTAKDVVLNEIVVSGSLRMPRLDVAAVLSGDTPNGHAVESTVAETTRSLRRSRRVSSTPQNGTGPATPKTSDKIVTIKKQYLGTRDCGDGDGDGDGDGKPDQVPLSSSSKKRKVESKSAPGAAVRKSRSKYDVPDEMLTNPNSPLVRARLRELLCSPMAWDILTDEEKGQILSKFPSRTTITDPDTPDTRPNVAALLNNNNFRNDVTRYQEGLSKGCHEPAWIQEAQAAHKARAVGCYDDFLATHFEEQWGMPISELPQATNSALSEADEQDNDASESIDVPEKATDRYPRANGTSKHESPDSPDATPTGLNLGDQHDEMKAPDNGIVTYADKTFEVEDTKGQSSDDSENQKQAQVEAASMNSSGTSGTPAAIP